MLEKVFSPVIRFFGILASSLGGITAVFTAIGFLAERSHLVMLGFTGIPVDLNRYLYSGAKFFAYLPFLFLYSVVLNALAFMEGYFLQCLIAALLLFIWYLLSPLKWVNTFNKAVRKWILNFVSRFHTGLLFLLIVFQFTVISQLLVANKIDNLLFVESEAVPPAIHRTWFVTDEAVLKSWIIHKNEEALFQYMGWLFLITGVCAYLLWFIVGSIRKKNSREKTLWQNIWLGANLIVLSTQLILLPLNFGILLMPNKYPLVEAAFEGQINEKLNLPEETPLVLLYYQNQDFYFYAHSQAKIWHIRSKDVRGVVYQGMEDVFDLKKPGSGYSVK